MKPVIQTVRFGVDNIEVTFTRSTAAPGAIGHVLNIHREGCAAAFGIQHDLENLLAGTIGQPPAPACNLTPAQYRVLLLVADGESTQQIADELFVSVSTVKVHLASIYRALGVHTRAAAVMVAVQAGLLGSGWQQ